MQLSGSTDLIAMSEDKSRFIEVSASMMDSCRKVGFNVLCSFPSVVVERDYPMCLKDIFLGRTKEILTSCNVVIMKQQFMLQRLNETAFVSFSPTSLTATETCGPKISQRILVGFETSNITPGCSVQAGSVTFVSGFSPMVSVNHVLTFLPESFFKISNDSEVVDAVERALQSFEVVDYNTLLKGGSCLLYTSPSPRDRG